MEIKSTIILLGIIASVIIPFILYSVLKRMKRKQFRNAFLSRAEKEKIRLSQKELWGNRYAIGIDTETKNLIHLIRRDENEEISVIDCSEVMTCRIVHTEKIEDNLSGNNNHINRLDLVFTFKGASMPEKVLEFYNNPEFMPSADDHSHIERWLNIVNENTKRNQISA
jgi:hypothetical protein